MGWRPRPIPRRRTRECAGTVSPGRVGAERIRERTLRRNSQFGLLRFLERARLAVTRGRLASRPSPGERRPQKVLGPAPSREKPGDPSDGPPSRSAVPARRGRPDRRSGRPGSSGSAWGEGRRFRRPVRGCGGRRPPRPTRAYAALQFSLVPNPTPSPGSILSTAATSRSRRPPIDR